MRSVALLTQFGDKQDAVPHLRNGNRLAAATSREAVVGTFLCRIGALGALVLALGCGGENLGPQAGPTTQSPSTAVPQRTPPATNVNGPPHPIADKDPAGGGAATQTPPKREAPKPQPDNRPQAKPKPLAKPKHGKPDGTGALMLDDSIAPIGRTWPQTAKERFQAEHVRRRCLADWSQGEMKVLLVTDAQGRFSHREILSDTTGSPKLSACIEGALEALHGVLVGAGAANRSFVQTLSPPHGNPIAER